MADKTVNRFGTAKGVMIADPLVVTALNLSTLALPSAAGEVDLQDFKNLTSLNLTGSSPTKLTLKGLALLATITGVASNTSLVEMSIEGCVAITSLNLSGCALSVGSVDNVLATLAAGEVSSGTLDLSGGTNAVPSEAGLANKTILESRSWTVAVNTGSYCAVNVDLSGDTGLTALDLNGCTIMETLDVSGCTNLASLDITGCTALTSLDISGCTSLTSITGIGDCTASVTFTATGSGLTSLDISSHGSLTTLTLTNCTALTDLNISSCISLITLSANGCTVLASLTASNVGSLESVYLQNSALVDLTLESGVVINLDTSGSTYLQTMSTFMLGQMSHPAIIVNCSGCALYSSSVNWLMANGVNSGEAGSQHSINTSGGTSSTPTKQGVTDMNTLLGRGWSIATN